MSLETNKEEQFEMDEEVAVKEKLNPSGDDASPSKVKFTNDGKNGEAKVDVDNGYGKSVGMSKEELMKYANDPFWRRLRMFLFILFWVVWLAMLIGAVVIVAVAPKCPATSSLPWWQKTTIYQVYVRSFKDSNADGEGDLKGVISKLDYFKDLGVSTLILSPIYPSMMRDSGYDVTNFTDIDSRYGTLEDFDELIAEAHNEERNMKIIIDFIPNHTSNRHPWFNASESGDPQYKDFYVWHNGTSSGTVRPGLPNNWKSVFGGQAWTWSEKRKQYYLHQFLSSQPDLNLRNPEVKKAMKEVLQFWLRRKVDGIRIDAASHLLEDENFENEKPNEEVKKNRPMNDYESLIHDKTKGHEENFILLSEWRKVVKQAGLKKILISEAYEPTAQLLKYYGSSDNPIMDLPFNFDLIGIDFKTTATQLKDKVESWLNAVRELAWPDNVKPPGPWSASVIGNHDNSRVASRLGETLADGLMMLAFTLPRNTPVVYYGDEIGLRDNVHNYPAKTASEGDNSRFPYRTPMQWNSNTSSAGFSNASQTWLQVSNDYHSHNVEAELKAPASHLKTFKSLVALRNAGHEAILLGKTQFPRHNATEKVFVMVRTPDQGVEGQMGYALILNINPGHVEGLTLKEEYLPDLGTVLLVDSKSPQDLVGKEISFSDLKLQPSMAMLIEFAPKQ